MGFDPTEPFSSMAAVAPFGARCRPGVHRVSLSAPLQHPRPAQSMDETSFLCASGIGRDRRPAFTALLHQRVRHSTVRGLNARWVRSSPGFTSSTGDFPRAWAPASGCLLPRTCRSAPSPPPKWRGSDREASPGVSISTKVGRSLSRPAAPLEVFPPFHITLWFTLPSAPGSWFHLGPRCDVTTAPDCPLEHRESVPPKSPKS